MAFTQKSVTGSFQFSDGSAADGWVTCTPTAVMTNGEITVGAPRSFRIQGGALVAASLAATDDAGTTPVGVTYKVEVKIDGQLGVDETFYIAIPAAGGAIDLATAPRLHVPPVASPYLTRAAADALYAPLAAEELVPYSPTFTPNTLTALIQVMECPGNVFVQPASGPTDFVLQLGFRADGGTRDVLFAPAIKPTTGVSRGPHPVPVGEALFAALRWSELISAWALLAVTVTGT